MLTICKACNLNGHGMINIYSHPNNIDGMFTSLTGLKIIEDDALCIPCYDDMKIAYSFRQKCLQSDLIKQAVVQTKIEPINQLPDPPDVPTDDHIEQSIEEINQPDEVNLKEHEISTTSESNPVELKCEPVIDEPVDSPFEITTSYIVDDDGELENDITNCENEDNDGLMMDYQELDKDVYDDEGISEESDDGYQISPSFLWKCTECNKSFARKGNFQKHIKIHFKTTTADQGSKKTNIRKKRNQTHKYSEEDVFQDIHETQCEFCFTELENAKERQIHELEHKNEEKPYKCPFNECASHFKEKYGLRNHIRIHSDYKRYKCRYCDHRFHQRGNIISHERLHTGEKPFLCPHCGKAFAESGNLKAHIRFHTGERPYSCSVCEKSFKTHYAHKIHVRTHTKERPYLCSECGKSFSSSGKLLVHKRIHTGQRPYKCVECPSAFVNSTGLKRHSKIHIGKRRLFQKGVQEEQNTRASQL